MTPDMCFSGGRPSTPASRTHIYKDAAFLCIRKMYKKKDLKKKRNV